MKRREHITPDLTPIIDIVFLLLIFFMVSSTFKKEELALLLTLPNAQSAVAQITREHISIELSVDTLAYQGKEVSFETLEHFLSRIGHQKDPINIRIDTKVTYGRLTQLLDMLNKYHLNNLALENEKP